MGAGGEIRRNEAPGLADGSIMSARPFTLATTLRRIDRECRAMRRALAAAIDRERVQINARLARIERVKAGVLARWATGGLDEMAAARALARAIA